MSEVLLSFRGRQIRAVDVTFLREFICQNPGLSRRRLSVKPGLTCLWQISGRNQLGFHRWMELDLEYIDNCSLWMDMKILAKTIPAVLSGRGAS